MDTPTLWCNFADYPRQKRLSVSWAQQLTLRLACRIEGLWLSDTCAIGEVLMKS
jgi:hypothetical protein